MPRPKSPIISRKRATEVALDVIDANGIEGFSLVLVAQRMGVRAASLYHHFKDRDDVLEEVARLLLIKATLPPVERGTDWREALVQVCLSSWRSALKHPRATPLLLQFFPRHLLLYTYEWWVRLFEANDVPAQSHLWILEGAERLTFGSALFAASSRARGIPPFPGFDGKEFPTLMNAVRANTLNEEEMFLLSLRTFLNAIPDAEPPPR